MRKCAACGKLINEQVQECPQCGASQSAPAPVAPAAAGPVQRGAAPAAPAARTPPSHAPVGELASFWIRLGAFVIDNFLALLIMLPFGGIAFFAAFAQASQGQDPSATAGVFNILGNLVALMFWGVNNIYLQGTRGWTIGKRLCKIVVLGPDGEVLGIGRNLLREIFKATISSCVCWLGFIWAAFDENRQAWHDKIAGSYVYYD